MDCLRTNDLSHMSAIPYTYKEKIEILIVLASKSYLNAFNILKLGKRSGDTPSV